MSGWAMAQFLNGLDLKGSSLKGFLLVVLCHKVKYYRDIFT
jgi:hypothetical protein